MGKNSIFLHLPSLNFRRSPSYQNSSMYRLGLFQPDGVPDKDMSRRGISFVFR